MQLFALITSLDAWTAKAPKGAQTFHLTDEDQTGWSKVTQMNQCQSWDYNSGLVMPRAMFSALPCLSPSLRHFPGVACPRSLSPLALLWQYPHVAEFLLSSHIFINWGPTVYLVQPSSILCSSVFFNLLDQSILTSCQSFPRIVPSLDSADNEEILPGTELRANLLELLPLCLALPYATEWACPTLRKTVDLTRSPFLQAQHFQFLKLLKCLPLA